MPMRSPLPRPLLGALLALALLLGGAAQAQSLADLLPPETALALGVRDLAAHEGRLEPFIAEFQRLGLGDALAALGGGEVSTEEMEAELPEAFAELGPLDLIGQEAWVAVSISPFNPLPAVTLAARVSPAARDAFAGEFAALANDPNAQRLSESGIDFWLLPAAETVGPDAPIEALAAAQAGDLLLLSSNPDTMRGVLRRFGGADEASFTNSAGYASTLGRLGGGNVYGYLDLATVADAVAPFAQPLGLPQLVERLQAALSTAGASAGVLRIVDTGIESASILAPNPSGTDLALYTLLTDGGSWDPAYLQLMPATGLSIGAGSVDGEAWWNYLNDLVASVPELGLSSLDEALAMVGLDLRGSVFDWTGERYALITTGAGDVMTSAGALPDNLLGETVYALESTDDEAARNGLALLFNNIAVTVASFADPTGGSGAAEIDVQQIAGVEVTRYAIIDGVSISTAVNDGIAFIATSDEAMELVLAARSAGAGLPATLAGLAAGVPAGARDVTLSDDRATLAATSAQITGQVGLLAGLGGAGALDFEATEAAIAALEEYLAFVASRLGGSVAVTTVEDGVVFGTGFSEISW